MLSRARLLRKLAAAQWRWGAVLFSLALGCSHGDYLSPSALAERILPPPSAPALPPPTAAPLPQPAAKVDRTAGQSPPGPAGPPQPVALEGVPCKPLTLADAVALAFRLQPRLRESVERIQQARGKEDIAFAAFLPTLSGDYLAGGYHIQAGGTGFQIPGVPNSPTFTILPLLGSIPSGIQGQTGFEVAELKLQWLVCDFGRRLGRYNQTGIALGIAQLQTERAYQTVASDVALAYYQVLRAHSLSRIAQEAVRRAEDDLGVARKLARGGEIVREKVLRAQTALAQAQRARDVADEAEAIAIAALNLAIGLNVSAPTCVVDLAHVPEFTLSLADCLRAAVENRREFQVARRAVQAAQEGSRVARADFAPRIVAEGNFLDFQQSNPRGHFDLPFGLIKLEWGLFEGGKRVAELRVADSRIRETAAQADSMADTIAFQVNQAYHQMVAAQKGIEHARPAVEQTRETYRLVLARARQGDAIPAEVTDAETALTRAQQDFANSVYDYLTALARLEYATGAALLGPTGEPGASATGGLRSLTLPARPAPHP